MQTLVADLRYAVRVLLRTPSFALAVVAVLALGIGANAAIFSIVNAVLLRPLPFDDPDRLVRVFHVPPPATFPGMARFSVSPANFYDWQREAHSVRAHGDLPVSQFTLTGRGTPQTVLAGAVGADFFEIVARRPAAGRVFRPDEDSPGRGSRRHRQRRVLASASSVAPDVLGQTLTLDGEAYTIVGVMPASFASSRGARRRATSGCRSPTTTKRRRSARITTRRSSPASSPAPRSPQAQAEIDVISKRLEQRIPRHNAGWGATVISLQELIVGDIRRTLVMLLAAVGTGAADRLRERRQPAVRARLWRAARSSRSAPRWAPDAPASFSRC